VFEINKRRLEEVGSDALQDMLDRRDWTDLPVHSAFAANKKAGIITDDDDDDVRAQSTTSMIEEVVPAKEVSAEEQADLDMEAEIQARWEMELEMMSLQATGRSGQRSSHVIKEELVPEEEEEVGEELDDIDMEAEIQARWEMELEMMALQSTGGAGQGDVSEVETLDSASESYIAEAAAEGEGAGGDGEEDYSDLLLDVDKWLQETS
jgi:hypothetical protein